MNLPTVICFKWTIVYLKGCNYESRNLAILLTKCNQLTKDLMKNIKGDIEPLKELDGITKRHD